MPDFKYTRISLEGPTFRLLRLLKGNSDPVQCQLFESKLAIPEQTTASTEHNCDYAALSYTWGQSSRPCNIIVDGSNMTVTKNAYLALRDLRYEDQDQVLWVDALCIDQSHDDERGQQVQQMGSIYSEAKRVIIWLGEATYDTDYVMDHMQQLEKAGIKLWPAVAHGLRDSQKDLLVEGLKSLLHRSWFRRVWIIQETGNAQAASIVCGSKSISASIFALMPSLLGITPDPHCQSILDIMPGSVRNSSWWTEKRDLHTMLTKFRKSEATEPRDQIYALLGISSDTRDTDLLKADYAKDIRDVVFDTTSCLLKFNKLVPRIYRFFDWSLREFLGKLDTLAVEVLKCAMNAKNEAVVKLLLERGAELEAKDKDGQTPLLWAAEHGHEAVVKVLLERGAELEIKGKDGQTPLLWAAEYGYEIVVKLLLERGAELESKDEDGRTPLSRAAANGHNVVVKLLLDRGAELETEDKNYGRTPLSRAASDGHEIVTKLLLERGAELESKDRDGRTPLLWAARHGHEVVVKLLLERGSELDSKDSEGLTPLSCATENGHEAAVKLLLERGAAHESKDVYDRTPLSWAAGSVHKEVVKLLLERSVKLKSKERIYSRKPLLHTAGNGHEAIIKLLLKRGAKLESKDRDGRTPLSWAAENGHEAVVKLLLDRGAELETEDKNYGRTPLSWAIKERHEAVVKLLLERGAEKSR